MIQFKISAPSDLTLFGEYAMKYNKSGLIAAINLHTRLIFIELSEDVIQLKFSQINLFLSISLQQFLVFYHRCKANMKQLHEQVLHFITCNSHLYSTENQKLILHIFFYLLIYITNTDKFKLTSFRVELSTELMMDTDFICLTPSAVCLAACFLHWSRVQNGAHDNFDDRDLKSICLYVTKCKKISCKIKSSAVIVCIFGSIIQYETTSRYNLIKRFTNISSETILLVDSKYPPLLEIKMQQLAELIRINPVAVNFMFDCINFATNLATNAFRRLSAIHTNNESNSERQRLNILLQHYILMTSININQKLLQLLNLSYYFLDEICLIAQKHGMYGKYTDIGDGRYAYIWCQPHMSERRISFLSQDLTANEFGVIMTSLARCGVKIE